MPLVVDEITYILAATGISVGTLAMLATSFPAALVPAAIRRRLILSVNSAPSIQTPRAPGSQLSYLALPCPCLASSTQTAKS